MTKENTNDVHPIEQQEDPINPTGGQLSDLDEGSNRDYGDGFQQAFAQAFPNQPNVPMELPIGAIDLLIKKINNDCPFDNMKESSDCSLIMQRLRGAQMSVVQQQLNNREG